MNKLTFIEKTHQYFIEAVSVSKIVELKHPFDKSKIPPNILKKAIIKGNCVHNALENYINLEINNGCGCEKEVKTHNKQIENGIKMLFKIIKNTKGKITLKPEYKDYFSYKNLIIAGTMDLVIYLDNKIYAIVDWKTTKDIHLDKYSLQLNLYNYILVKKHIIIPKLFIANVNRNELVEAKHKSTPEIEALIKEYICIAKL